MSLHFSPGSNSASFVELVGNVAVLSGTKLSKDIADIFLHIGKFPIECLPAVLHESTHNYCFHMPVGHALSVCFLEAVRSCLADPSGNARDDHFAEALIRYDLVTEAMRPIAEGIALYAEFDACPGDSRASISPPLSDLLPLFGGSLPDDFLINRKAGSAIDFLLYMARLTGSTTARRETLLAMPFLDDDDGYLTGYWLIKNWRLHLIDQLGSKALFDTDFYLQFIANYFYGDLTLASMIVDFDKYRFGNLNYVKDGQEDFANAFLTHFQKRLTHLVQGINGSDVDRIETALSSTSGYSFDDVQIIAPCDVGCTFGQYDHAYQKLWLRIVNVEWKGLGAAMGHLLNMRDWIAYASFETSIRINEDSRFFVGEGEHACDKDFPVIAGNVQAVGLEPGLRAGAIELVRHRSDGSLKMHRLIWRGAERVAVLLDFNDINQEEASIAASRIDVEDARLPPFSSVAIRHLVNGLTKLVRSEMAALSVATFVAEDCKSQLKEIRSEIFAMHLEIFVSKSGQPLSASQLREPLLQLCENNVIALRAIAAAGFYNGGMLLMPTDVLSAEQVKALENCPVELIFRRGEVICFRF